MNCPLKCSWVCIKKKDHAFIKHPVIKNDIFNDIGCCDYHVSNTGHTTVEMVAENKCLSCFNICILDPGYHWLSPESYRQAGFVIRYLRLVHPRYMYNPQVYITGKVRTLQ